jgi:hypothetical protein
MPQNLSAQFFYQAQKFWISMKKGLHWASVGREMYHVCCSPQPAYKLVKASYAISIQELKQTTGAKELTFLTYILWWVQVVKEDGRKKIKMFCIALMVTFDLFKLTYRMT